MQKTDSELVREAQSGDESAFEELMRRNYSISLKLAISIVRDREDAEDEVQNAFWSAYRHLGQFQHEAQFSTWLSRIVVNQCLMRLRKLRHARLVFLDEPVGADQVRFELLDQSPGPETQTAQREISAFLRREIRRIPPLLRKVMLLRDIQEIEMPEVARHLGISVPAAKSRLLRARSHLRERLQEHLTGTG